MSTLREAARDFLAAWPNIRNHPNVTEPSEVAALRAALATPDTGELDVERLGLACERAYGWSPTHAWQQAQRIAREYATLATPDTGERREIVSPRLRGARVGDLMLAMRLAVSPNETIPAGWQLVAVVEPAAMKEEGHGPNAPDQSAPVP